MPLWIDGVRQKLPSCCHCEECRRHDVAISITDEGNSVRFSPLVKEQSLRALPVADTASRVWRRGRKNRGNHRAPKKPCFLGKRNGNEAATECCLRHSVIAQFAVTKTEDFFRHRKSLLDFSDRKVGKRLGDFFDRIPSPLRGPLSRLWARSRRSSDRPPDGHSFLRRTLRVSFNKGRKIGITLPRTVCRRRAL